MSPGFTFYVSLFVALLCIPLSIYQAGRLGEALEPPVLSGGRYVLDDPTMAITLAAQSLEVAYGFPAMVLTAIGYADLFGWNAYRFPALYGSLQWTPRMFEVRNAGARVFGGDARVSCSSKHLGQPTAPVDRFDARYGLTAPPGVRRCPRIAPV